MYSLVTVWFFCLHAFFSYSHILSHHALPQLFLPLLILLCLLSQLFCIILSPFLLGWKWKLFPLACFVLSLFRYVFTLIQSTFKQNIKKKIQSKYISFNYTVVCLYLLSNYIDLLKDHKNGEILKLIKPNTGGG